MPRLSPTLTIMNRTRHSMVEMDLRPVIGRVGIDSWRPCSLLVAAAVTALGMSADADAGQVRGQLVAAEIAVLRQLRKSGRSGRCRGHGGPLQRTGMTGYPTILHASAELAEWLKTGRSK